MRGDQYIRESREGHDHLANPLEVEARRVKEKAQDMMRLNPKSTSRAVINEAFKGVDDTFTSTLTDGILLSV